METLCLYIACSKQSHHQDLTKKKVWASCLIITAWLIIFLLATGYLTPTDAVSSFLFLKQLCPIVQINIKNWRESGESLSSKMTMSVLFEL